MAEQLGDLGKVYLFIAKHLDSMQMKITKSRGYVFQVLVAVDKAPIPRVLQLVVFHVLPYSIDDVCL